MRTIPLMMNTNISNTDTRIAPTPAKINLSLDIIGKREDGYHEIRSIMQMINLYDYLTFDIEDAQENQNSMVLSVALFASEEDELRAVNRPAKQSRILRPHFIR